MRFGLTTPSGKKIEKGFSEEVTNHRLKAVALVTGCKPCSGQRPAK
jgi:hypothetical protein